MPLDEHAGRAEVRQEVIALRAELDALTARVAALEGAVPKPRPLPRLPEWSNSADPDADVPPGTVEPFRENLVRIKNDRGWDTCGRERAKVEAWFARYNALHEEGKRIAVPDLREILREESEEAESGPEEA